MSQREIICRGKVAPQGKAGKSKARVRTTDTVQTFSVPEDCLCTQITVKIESGGS